MKLFEINTNYVKLYVFVGQVKKGCRRAHLDPVRVPGALRREARAELRAGGDEALRREGRRRGAERRELRLRHLFKPQSSSIPPFTLLQFLKSV